MAQVTKVEYYNNGELIGTRTAEPFNEFLWQSTPQGTNVLTAVLYVDDIAVHTSDAITITALNSAPTGTSDAYNVNEGAVLTVAAPGILANDIDAQGDTLTAELVSGTTNGVLNLNSDGSFTYTPNEAYYGADSFTYRAFDGQAYSGNIVVNISVDYVNKSATGTPDSYIVSYNNSLVVDAITGVLANDSDVEGDPMTVEVVDQPLNGILSLYNDGSFTYTPNTNYIGADSFTYKIFDGNTYSEPIPVTLSIEDVWYKAVLEDYAERVTIDYGFVEDTVTLESEFSLINESDYYNVPMLLNPNGGYKAGKIYNLADKTLGTQNHISDSLYFKDANWTNGLTSLSDSAELPPNRMRGVVKLFDVPNSALGLRNATAGVVGQHNVAIWVKRFDETSPNFFNISTSNGSAWNTGNSQKFSITDSWQQLNLNVQVTGTGNLTIFFGAGTSSGAVDNDCLGKVLIFAPQATSNYGLKPYSQTPKYDLMVTGGGGTRTNATGNTEGLAFNTLPNSYNLIGDGSWSLQNECIMTLDQVGITGQANTAFTLSDNNSTDYAQLSKNLSTFSRQQVKVSVWVLKDNDETRFPEFYIQFRVAGTGVYEDSLVQLNTKTGAHVIRGGQYDDLPYQVNDRGDWWEIAWSTSSDTDRLSTFVIRPAFATTIGGFETTATGSIVIGHVGVYTGNTNLLAPPITTKGSPSAALPKIDYRAGGAAFLFENTNTNHETHSYDLISNAAFTVNASATMTLDQVGITGVANQAILLTDNSASDYGILERSLYSLTSGIHKVSVWIKKDNDETRFPEINITFRRSSDSLGQQSLIDINTKTGEIAYRLGRNNNNTQVNDRGDWWEVVTASIDPVDRLSTFEIYPAIQNTLGGSATTSTTGSIVIGHIGIYKGDAMIETPVLTSGATATRTSTLAKTTIPATTPKSIFLDTEITNIGTDKILFNFYNSTGAGQYYFQGRVNAAGDVSIFVLNNYNNATAAGNIVTLGLTKGRHKFMFCYGGGLEVKIFVDGLEYTVNMTCCGAPANLDTLSIGSDSGGTSTTHFNDSMYDVRMWPTDERAQGINLTTI